MASLTNDGGGKYRVLVMVRGKRRTVRLGKMQKSAAQSVQNWIERLAGAVNSNSPMDSQTAAWLGGVDDALRERMARADLCDPPEQAEDDEPMTLKELLDLFVARATVKPATMAAYKQTTNSLLEHFKEHCPIESITPGGADGWRRSLSDSELAKATQAKRVHVARAIFKRAVRWGLLDSSPFADLKAGSQANPDRTHYVRPEVIDAVLAVCPDDQWRAIIALTRFCGLRCPSEVRLLRWGDVNWERSRLTVRSPKTAGSAAHAVRIVPLVPEVRPILERLFAEAEEGAEAVVPRLVDPKVNLRTHFERLIQRAGYKAWPRLFHNLRASAAMDFCERFPSHVAASWLGHSPLIAASHYLATRDEHFDMAVRDPERGAESGAPEAQNAAQQAIAPDGTESNKTTQAPEDAELVHSGAPVCDSIQSDRWAILDSNQ